MNKLKITRSDGSTHEKNDEHKWVVVNFVRGISAEEHNALPENDLCREIYKSSDQHGNNKNPYCWAEFGPGSFFGQEAALWCELPLI